MPRMRCSCGHTIVDQADGLAYKGVVLRDQESAGYFDSVATEVAAFMAAVREDRRASWLFEQFGSNYPPGATDREVLADLLHDRWCNVGLVLYACEQCGRLKLQAPSGGLEYRSFAAEGAWAGSLAPPPSEPEGEPGPSDDGSGTPDATPPPTPTPAE
jgi:hypothetical protein